MLFLAVMYRLNLNVGVKNLAAAVADLQQLLVRDGHSRPPLGGSAKRLSVVSAQSQMASDEPIYTKD